MLVKTSVYLKLFLLASMLFWDDFCPDEYKWVKRSSWTQKKKKLQGKMMSPFLSSSRPFLQKDFKQKNEACFLMQDII